MSQSRLACAAGSQYLRHSAGFSQAHLKTRGHHQGPGNVDRMIIPRELYRHHRV